MHRDPAPLLAGDLSLYLFMYLFMMDIMMAEGCYHNLCVLLIKSEI